MSITAAELIARIAVQGAKEAAVQLGEVGASAESTGDKLKTLAGAGLAIAGAALVGIGVESVKMAADFQQATLSLVAHAGLATDQINNVSQAVLAMAPAVGRSPIELADALYPILSAFSGITNQSAKTTLSLSTLKMAFETVAGTTVDGTAVANAAVGTFNALGLATNNAGTNAQRMTKLFDVMDKTVQLGNMTWDQYKNVIAKVATSSNTAHVSFNEASAALATLTSQGMNVQKAGTYLVNTFNTLEIKTDLLASRAKKLHISFDESKYASMNLADKIEYLNKVTDGNSQKLLALMGNNSTALITFEKLSTGVNTYRADLDALNHSQGALKSSFDTAASGFNFHAQQLKAAFDVLFIKIGTQLLPILGKLLDAVTPLITQFADWIDKNNVLTNAFNTTVSIIQNSINFYNQWKGVIQNTAIALAVFFTPALIKAGVEAVVSAAKITYNFVASLILTGAEGWAAAGKLAVYIGALIASGYQAVIAAAKITFSFIASLIATGVQAYVAAYAVSGSFVVSLGMVGTQAVASGAKLAVNFVGGLTAARTASLAATPAIAGVGTTAAVATGPIVALGAIAAATFLLIQDKAYIMDKSVKTSTGEMVGAAQLHYHQLAAGANSSGQQIQTDLTNHANTAKKNVIASFDSMDFWVRHDSGEMSDTAKRIFGQLVNDVKGDWSQLEQATKDYWNSIAAYIDNKSGLAAAAAQRNFDKIHMPNLKGTQFGTLTHLAGNAEGTDNWRGGLTWVGEKGPEILNLPHGSQIIPNNKIGSMGGGSAPVIHNHIDVYLDGQRMTGQLMPRIVQSIRTATGAKI